MEPEILFSEPFDRIGANDRCDGSLSLIRESDGSEYFIVTPAPDGTETRKIPAEDAELFLTCTGGSGEIGLKQKDGTPQRLCCFTMDHTAELAEFVRAYREYRQTGIPKPPDHSKIFCPKCGKKFLPGTRICPACSRKLSGIRSLLRQAKPFLPGFLTTGAILLFSNVFSLLTPQINRILVDGYLTEGAPRNTLPVSPAAAVILLAVAILLCQVIKRILTIFAARLRNKTSTRFVDRLRTTLYAKVSSLSLNSVSRHSTGALINLVSSDCGLITDFIRTETIWIADTGVLFLAVCGWFAVTRPILLAFVMIPVPLVCIVARKSWKQIRRRYSRQWILNSRANSVLHDIIQGIRVVKIFGKEAEETEKFRGVNQQLMEIQKNNEATWAVLTPTMSFLAGAGEFLVLYFGAMAVLGPTFLGPQMTVGELVQTVSYVGLIYSPLQHLSGLPQSVANFLTSAARVSEVLDEENEIPSGGITEPITEGKIEFKNVTFGYAAYEPVLKDLSLTVSPGETVGIVGASGAGKSTVINLLMRLYDVQDGGIFIDGHDVREYDKSTLAGAIGTVFQETFLFAGTIYENILYARPDAAPEEVFRAARIACCHEFILKLPEGYQTKVGHRGYTLSGGERQRIALARAILKDPKILILDEATASLDTETEEKIQKATEYLTKGRTTVAIAHRLSTLRNADRIIVVDKGHVIEQGTHRELLEKRGAYFKLVTAQQQTTKMAANAE